MAGPAQWLRLDGEASVGSLLCLLFLWPIRVGRQNANAKCGIPGATYVMELMWKLSFRSVD